MTALVSGMSPTSVCLGMVALEIHEGMADLWDQDPGKTLTLNGFLMIAFLGEPYQTLGV